MWSNADIAGPYVYLQIFERPGVKDSESSRLLVPFVSTSSTRGRSPVNKVPPWAVQSGHHWFAAPPGLVQLRRAHHLCSCGREKRTGGLPQEGTRPGAVPCVLGCARRLRLRRSVCRVCVSALSLLFTRWKLRL